MGSTNNDVSMNIVGVVRNGGVALSKTISRIEDLTARLSRYSIVIATNDNMDGTDRLLTEYSERCAEVLIIRLDGLVYKVPERVERITVARNSVLEKLERLDHENTFTLVLDLDGPNACLDSVAVMRALKRRAPRWDAVFGNSRPAYYDLYALRCEGWCNEDVWQVIHDARKPLLRRRKWKQNLLKRIIYDRQFNIPIDCSIIPVDSAFCGAGLYRTRALKNLRYSCRDNFGRLVCEHVALHYKMRARGARLFIDPAFKTIAPTEHLGEGSGAPFFQSGQIPATRQSPRLPEQPLKNTGSCRTKWTQAV